MDLLKDFIFNDNQTMPEDVEYFQLWLQNLSDPYTDTTSNATSNHSMLLDADKINMKELSFVEMVIFATVFAVIAVVGVLGNILVILSISTDKKMRSSVMNVVLLNLAFADLFNLIACAPDFVMAIIGQGWILHNDLCPVLRYFEEIFLYASLLMQLTVCVERFIAISMPMKVHILCTQTKFLVLAVCLWLLATLCAIPYAFHTVNISAGLVFCVFPENRFPGFKYMEFLSFYLLPLVITIILYGRISFILWSSNRHLHEGSSQSSMDNSAETLKTRKNVVKMLIACVGQYFLGYSPIQVLFLMGTMYTGEQTPMPPFNALLAMNAFAYSCSATNPLLYTIFSQKFRRRFLRIIFFWQKNRRKGSESSSRYLHTDDSRKSFRQSNHGSPFASRYKYTPVRGNIHSAATTELNLAPVTPEERSRCCSFEERSSYVHEELPSCCAINDSTPNASLNGSAMNISIKEAARRVSTPFLGVPRFV